jgi:hypothetical protein
MPEITKNRLGSWQSDEIGQTKPLCVNHRGFIESSITGKVVPYLKAVSRRHPTAAWVRAQVRSCGICGGQSSTGVGFLQVLQFPLTILIPPTSSNTHSSTIFRGWYNRWLSDRRAKWTQSHPTTRNLKKKKKTEVTECFKNVRIWKEMIVFCLKVIREWLKFGH